MVAKTIQETVNAFALLGVPTDCSFDTAKAAYRRMLMKVHPDRGGNNDAFQAVQRAYSLVHATFTKNKDIHTSITVSLTEAFTGANMEFMITAENCAKIVQISVPAGVNHGDTIRFEKCGDHSIKHLTAGDLYVKVCIEQHDQFTRKNNDCHCIMDIPAKLAMLGGSVSVTDLGGMHHDITIDRGTQPNTVHTIYDRGFLNKTTLTRGNLYVYFNIILPTIYDETMRICDLP